MKEWHWQKLVHVSSEQATNWTRDFPDATNTGVLTFRTPTLDIDIEYAEAAEAVEDLVRDRYGDQGYVLTRIGKAPKRAIPFRTDTPFAKIAHKVIRADGVEERFEFLSDGQQVVVHGDHPDTKQPYRWAHGDLLTVPRADLPLISAEDAQALIKDAAELVTVEHGYRDKPRPRTPMGGGPPLPADWVAYFDEDNLIDHDNNAAAIMALICGGTHPGVVSNLFQQKIRALIYGGPPSPRDGMEGRRALARRYLLNSVRLYAAIAYAPDSEAALHTRLMFSPEVYMPKPKPPIAPPNHRVPLAPDPLSTRD